MKKSKNAVKTIKGYAIFNTEDGEYMDNDFGCCNENENPYVYDNIEDAQDAIEENSNNAYDYEIHKIEYGIQIKEVYKRKVSYELAEND